MTRFSSILLLAGWTLATPAVAEGPGLADSPSMSIRWDVDPTTGRVATVTLVGLPAATLAKAAALGDKAPWPDAFAVNLDAEGPARAAMLGGYRVEGGEVRFTPLYPLERGRRYRATYDPAKLPGGAGNVMVSSHLVARPERPPTAVAFVSPSGDRLPENLLKFYLHFSAPMGRGEAYEHIRLLDQDGKAVVRPFLELGEELWDPTQTRLTILIDPGRIKRGLQPRERFGPVLEAGKGYTLAVDPAWRDAEGLPLRAPFRKTFRAGPADEAQPDPRAWTIAPPVAGTAEPLTLTFPGPLDRALLESALTVVDARRAEVAGKVEVGADQSGWKFVPEKPWPAGDYHLEVDIELEDLAGNSIRRPFEVDVQRDTPARPEARAVRLPFRVRGAASK